MVHWCIFKQQTQTRTCGHHMCPPVTSFIDVSSKTRCTVALTPSLYVERVEDLNYQSNITAAHCEFTSHKIITASHPTD